MQMVEGEIALTVDYAAGRDSALVVLSGATQMIAALDAMDRALLSSVNSELEPVSILNDVQHSSLKILLARALRQVPDDAIHDLDWRKWVGGILLKGKHVLLSRLDADAPALAAAIEELKPDYQAAPGLIGYSPPTVAQVREAMNAVTLARRMLAGSAVIVQSEYGDITIPEAPAQADESPPETVEQVTNHGREWLKVRYPDMLGNAQWTVQRGGRAVRVTILHQAWLDAYHRREVHLLPGDALDCEYEETVGYDGAQNETGRSLTVIQVHGVKSPPVQKSLL